MSSVETTIVLEKWQVLELFSKVVCQFDDEVSVADMAIDKDDILYIKVKHYAERSNTDLIVEAISEKFNLNPKIASKEISKHIGILAVGILSGQPVEINKDIYLEMKSVVNKGVNSDDYIDFFNTKKIYHPILSNAQKNLSNTHWWLYFSDRTEASYNRSQQDGVTKNLLILGRFGKAEIYHYSLSKKSTELYVGDFHEHPLDNKFLVLNLKMADNLNDSNKDLKIIFYTGSTHTAVNLMLGQFINIGKSVYSGSVMADFIGVNMSKRRSLTKLGFYIKSYHENRMPPYVWKYFAIRWQNVMRTTNKVITRDKFNDWYIGKEKINSLLLDLMIASQPQASQVLIKTTGKRK